MTSSSRRKRPAKGSPQLVRPSVDFLRSYRAAIDEGAWDVCRGFGGPFKWEMCFDDLENDHDKHVFWLVYGKKYLGSIEFLTTEDEMRQTIGEYDIRPSAQGNGYGKLMLKLALVELQKLGIESVFFLVDQKNVRSIRVIEGNGGRFAYKSIQGPVYTIDIPTGD